MNRTAMVHRGSVVQLAGMDAASSGIAPLGYVYVIGAIQPRFGTDDVEKLYFELEPPDNIPDKATNSQRLQAYLKKYPFFAREMVWTLNVGGQLAYELTPRSPTELDAFIAAMPLQENALDRYSVIVGTAQPMMGDLPGVLVNRIITCTLEESANKLISRLKAKNNTNIPTKDQIVEIFTHTLQLANNTGDMDEQRALNYVFASYPEAYVLPTMQGTACNNIFFVGVETRPSVNDAGGRRVIEIILKYQNQTAGIPVRYFTSVDVTGQFPFITQYLKPYFDR